MSSLDQRRISSFFFLTPGKLGKNPCRCIIIMFSPNLLTILVVAGRTCRTTVKRGCRRGACFHVLRKNWERLGTISPPPWRKRSFRIVSCVGFYGCVNPQHWIIGLKRFWFALFFRAAFRDKKIMNLWYDSKHPPSYHNPTHFSSFMWWSIFLTITLYLRVCFKCCRGK